MTNDEKELYAAMMVYYLMRGTIGSQHKYFPEYIRSWKRHQGVRRGMEANTQNTVSLFI